MRASTARLGGSAVTSSAGILLAGLVPKCPLCVAAALSAWGVGASTAGALAPAVRPFLLVQAVGVLVLLAAALMRAGARADDAGARRRCCSPGSGGGAR